MTSVLLATVLAAAPVLTSANARIVVASPTTCDVDLTVAVADAIEVEHRVESFAGGRIELVDLRGAERVGDTRQIGRTLALILRPLQSTYSIRYRAEQPEGRRDRCPLWLPTVPSDGQSRAVRLSVDLPAGATPAGTMPGFTWTGTHGVATLGNLPAFVRVPYAAAGESSPWDVSRVMDAVAVFALAGASIIWLRRRRG